jgi:hypothetical protein
MTEADALTERGDEYEGRTYEEWEEDRNDSINEDYLNYLNNKSAKVGTKIVCAENRCMNMFVKKSYQQAFCCTKHKNQFWNRQKLL